LGLALALGAALVALVARSRDDGPSGIGPGTPPIADVGATEPPALEANVEITGGPFLLRGVLVRPAGRGPFSAVVYNHGSEQDPSIEYQRDVGTWFRDHGYVVLFPYRRGASGSDGPYWGQTVEGQPLAKRETATVRALEDENADVVASIQWLATKAFVDPRHMVVAGCSFGGIEALLTTEATPNVYAVLDFAGASATWASSPLLRARLEKAVHGAQAPVFFLQAENDYDTTPSTALARSMANDGKPHRVRIFPPHGTTPMAGHAGFCNHGMREWGPDVLAFLEEAARRE
jgi:carboxymethylenebutenolidase